MWIELFFDGFIFVWEYLLVVIVLFFVVICFVGEVFEIGFLKIELKCIK